MAATKANNTVPLVEEDGSGGHEPYVRATLAAGSAAVGSGVQGTIGGAQAIAAAGNYTALDVLSNSASSGAGVPWIFDDCAAGNGGSGFIDGAVVTFSAQSMVARMRLWLFHTAPTTSEMDDNEAFSLDDDDKTKLIGSPIDFIALADVGEVSIGFSYDVRQFRCAAADNRLYGILQTLDAETNEAAAMTCTIRLNVVRY